MKQAVILWKRRIDLFHKLIFHIYINEPFWSRLKVRIPLYFTHADEVRKRANYHT